MYLGSNIAEMYSSSDGVAKWKVLPIGADMFRVFTQAPASTASTSPAPRLPQTHSHLPAQRSIHNTSVTVSK